MPHYPLDNRQLRLLNLINYNGIPPSWDLIERAIQKSGLKFQSTFELVFGIGQKLLSEYKNGKKMLPAKYWHIFYDFDRIRQQNHHYRSSKTGSKTFA